MGDEDPTLTFDAVVERVKGLLGHHVAVHLCPAAGRRINALIERSLTEAEAHHPADDDAQAQAGARTARRSTLRL